MTKDDVLKDAEFEVITEARVDAKHRIGLGQLVSGQVRNFKVYRNAHGQIMLDPMVSVPAHEVWLFKNPRAASLVHRGLEDAKHGRLVKSKEDFSKYARREA